MLGGALLPHLELSLSPASRTLQELNPSVASQEENQHSCNQLIIPKILMDKGANTRHLLVLPTILLGSTYL